MSDYQTVNNIRNPIPFYSFSKQNNDIAGELPGIISQVIDSQWYINGKYLEQFEKEFAEYIGTKYAIGVGSGLDALKISLKALNLNSGDEVIVPSHTFIATLSAVLQNGLIPVLADVDPVTFTMDPQQLSSLITSRSRAVIPVHLYGIPAVMGQIMEISTKKGLFVIEDFAQSTGAKYGNARTGSLGIINGTSFYPVKGLGAFGDGGIITTNDKEMADFCLKYREISFRNDRAEFTP